MKGMFPENKMYLPLHKAGLYLTTFGLAAFGLLVQVTQNALEEYIYTGQMVNYWFRMFLVLGGIAAAAAATRWLQRSHAFIYEILRLALASGMLVLAVYGVISAFSDYLYKSTVITVTQTGGVLRVSWGDAVWKMLRSAKLFGCIDSAWAEQVASCYSGGLWRWESHAVLPVIWMRYGLWTLVVYVALAGLWVYFAVKCAAYVPRDMNLAIHLNESPLLKIDLNKGAYVLAMAAMLAQILGPVLAVMDLCGYSGGVPFSATVVQYLSGTVRATGMPLALMLYILSLPGQEIPEEAEDAQWEVEEMTTILSRERFLQADFEEIISDMADPCALPYFHVPEGWYYMVNDCGAPQQADKDLNLYVCKKGAELKMVDPADPAKGICHRWVDSESDE